MKAAAGEEVNAKVPKEQHLAIESSQLHALHQEHIAIKWAELAAATEKASKAAKEEEVQKCNKKAKEVFNVDNNDAPVKMTKL